MKICAANRWIVAVAAASLVTLAGCRQRPTASPAVKGYFQTPFQDESQFVIQNIITDIAEMGYFAGNHEVPPEGKVAVTAKEIAGSTDALPKYEVSITWPGKKLKTTVDINGPIWSPEVYAGVTREIFTTIKVKLPAKSLADSRDTEMLRTLLDLKAATIETENLKLSKSLGSNFSENTLHERAAVLVGAFALREHSGDFFEIRSPLCRMTAHLAMARAFAGGNGYGPNGKVAEAMLYTLMNNEKDALAKAAALDQTKPELVAWSRALFARNTHDYRPLAAVQKRSVLETIEYFGAYAHSVDARMAWDKLSRTEQTSLPDAYRIAFCEPQSVELGHDLLALSLPLEFYEAGSVFRLSETRTADQTNIVSALNQLPERCFMYGKAGPQLRIIGRGQWAMFFQRHLCHAIQHDFNFMQHMWGVHQEASEFAFKCDKSFSGLRLYPFVQCFNSTDEASYHAAVDAALLVTRATPHLVPERPWGSLQESVPFAPHYPPYAEIHLYQWHTHNPLPGTAYDPGPRVSLQTMSLRGDLGVLLPQMHERAPYDFSIARCANGFNFGHLTKTGSARAMYQPILDYDIHAMYRLSRTITNDPAGYEELMAKIAALEPSYYFDLGAFVAQSGNKDKAAKYMQQGMDLCKDSVQAANNAGWLANYYFENGQTSKAMELADMAAETYSYRGLETKANLLEAMGRYSEALEYHKKIEERYENSSDLIAFCRRYKSKTGRSDFDETLQRRIRNNLAGNVEKVTLADFKTPPPDGVLITQVNSETSKAGLAPGDVIVAVFGIRVHNFDQYSSAREASVDPVLDLIVWQSGRFQEIHASPPDHRFGVPMGSYVRR